MFKWVKKFLRPILPTQVKCHLDNNEIRKIIRNTDLSLAVKKSILLCPELSSNTLEPAVSKIGGIGISCDEISCRTCNHKLSLFIQIFKADNICDFIPENFDVFEVFRCSNPDCDGVYNEHMDVDTRFRFTKIQEFTLDKESNNSLIRIIPECRLNPVEIDDYPDYQDYEIEYLEKVNVEYSACENEIFDIVADEFGPRLGSKIGGYPAWIQNSYDFYCSTCNTKKEFILQISSEEAISKKENYNYKNGWSPHKVMIGDVGNIYAFKCRNCNDLKITTYWDCS